MNKEARIRIEIDRWCEFCGLDPEDLGRKDVKEIAERSGASLREVWEQIEFWFKD